MKLIVMMVSDKLLSLTLTTEAGEEEGGEMTTSLLPIYYPNTHKTYFALVWLPLLFHSTGYLKKHSIIGFIQFGPSYQWGTVKC